MRDRYVRVEWVSWHRDETICTMSEFHVYGSDMMNAMMVGLLAHLYVDVGVEDGDACNEWDWEEEVTCSANHQRCCQGGNAGDEAGTATNRVCAAGSVSRVPAIVRAV